LKSLKLSEQSKLLIVILSSIAVYCYFYLIAPEAPGHDVAHMEGWFGWFDQGQYLKAAIAFGVGDFSPSSHYYPPLYPYIGHLFYGIMPRDPFFFINCLSFVVFSTVFITISSRYIGYTISLLAFYYSVAFHYETMKHFVIPWTTSITVISYSICILCLSNLNSKKLSDKSIYLIYPALMSASMGVLGLARPIDAVLAAVFFSSYGLVLLKKSKSFYDIKKLYPTVAVFLSGPVISIAIYAIFNDKVFGSPLGGYLNSTAGRSGYFFTELFQKTVSLLFDAGSLFAVPGEGVAEHYPWIALSFSAIVLCFFIGDSLLRTIAVALVLQFCIYAPYGDLLPVGVWRYGNIHYFKWGIPYLMLFAIIAILWCLPDSLRSRRTNVLIPAFVLIFTTALLSLSFEPGKYPKKAILTGNKMEIFYDLPANVKFIDISGIHYDYTAIYFGNHELLNGDKPLSVIKDFRLIPTSYGTRIYFNKPIHTKHITINFDNKITFDKKIDIVESGYYKYVLSLNKLLNR